MDFWIWCVVKIIGFFHILKDFDEGKHSCRRKLEHHNKRRRRGPNADQNVLDEKENNSIEIIHIEEVVQDDEQSKGIIVWQISSE